MRPITNSVPIEKISTPGSCAMLPAPPLTVALLRTMLRQFCRCVDAPGSFSFWDRACQSFPSPVEGEGEGDVLAKCACSAYPRGRSVLPNQWRYGECLVHFLAWIPIWKDAMSGLMCTV